MKCVNIEKIENHFYKLDWDPIIQSVLTLPY